jgi:UDP-N-acetylmuramoylalanine-D-glutamate ligase
VIAVTGSNGKTTTKEMSPPSCARRPRLRRAVLATAAT